jgi:hypothetical protein
MNAFKNVRITDAIEIVATAKRPAGELPAGFLQAVRDAVERKYSTDRAAMMDDPMWQLLTRRIDDQAVLAA